MTESQALEQQRIINSITQLQAGLDRARESLACKGKPVIVVYLADGTHQHLTMQQAQAGLIRLRADLAAILGVQEP